MSVVQNLNQHLLVKRKTKIALVLPNLEGGGSHKVILTLANHLDRQKFEGSLIVAIDEGAFSSMVPADIETIKLGVDWLPKGYLKLLKTLRSLRPDIVLSATGHLNLMVLSLKPLLISNPRIIIRESTNLTALFKDTGYAWNTSVMKRLFSLLYPKSEGIVCQSDSMIEDLRCNFGVPPNKMTLIRNPVDTGKIRNLALRGGNPFEAYGRGPHIVSAGRLTYAKNFDLLLNIFADYHSKNKTARLCILGDGPLRDELTSQIAKMGLTDAVFLPGFQDNPFPWFANANLFVLSSRYEGLPNVLLEAIACGCPVLARDGEGGAREIMKLTGNVDRLLPDSDFFITDEYMNRGNNPSSIELIERYFGLQKIVSDYESLLSN